MLKDKKQDLYVYEAVVPVSFTEGNAERVKYKDPGYAEIAYNNPLTVLGVPVLATLMFAGGSGKHPCPYKEAQGWQCVVDLVESMQNGVVKCGNMNSKDICDSKFDRKISVKAWNNVESVSTGKTVNNEERDSSNRNLQVNPITHSQYKTIYVVSKDPPSKVKENGGISNGLWGYNKEDVKRVAKDALTLQNASREYTASFEDIKRMEEHRGSDLPVTQAQIERAISSASALAGGAYDSTVSSVQSAASKAGGLAQTAYKSAKSNYLRRATSSGARVMGELGVTPEQARAERDVHLSDDKKSELADLINGVEPRVTKGPPSAVSPAVSRLLAEEKDSLRSNSSSERESVLTSQANKEAESKFDIIEDYDAFASSSIKGPGRK
ncbi:MAG: hypothetical protein AB7F64_09400 [Gammaproteobacteria bacterium]